MSKIFQPKDMFAWLSLGVMLWMAWNAATAIFISLDWPLVHDAPILHYVASMIFKGYMPYRDIIEINLPFTYWLHMLAIVAFGDGDFAFRLFDLSGLLLSASLIAALCWRKAPMLGVAAGLAFVVLHVSDGAASMGQRDFLMVPFLLGAALCVLHAGAQDPRRSARAWLLAGVCAGCAASIKPIAVLLPVLLLAVAAIDEKWNTKNFQRFRTPCLRMAIGFALPFLAALVWLLHNGIIEYFLDVMMNLVAAIYAEVESPDWFEKSGVLVTATLVISLITYVGHAGEERSRRHMLLQAGILYGLLHYVLQRKGFWYNLYPTYAFAGAALACSLRGFTQRLRVEGKLIVCLALFGACIYASPVGLLAPSSLYGAEWLNPYFKQLDDNMKAARARVLGEFPDMQRQDMIKWRVHFFDFSVGALWAYAYREGWEPVSRFQHPYPFYMAENNPAMQHYREEMLAGFEKQLPHVMVVSKQSWPRADGVVYDVIEGKDGNTDISSFFKTHYQLAYANGMYRIYALVNPDKPKPVSPHTREKMPAKKGATKP